MRILGLIFLGIMTAIVMASEGDFSGLAMIGTVLVYAVFIGLAIWFLAATGWAGLMLIALISILISIYVAANDK